MFFQFGFLLATVCLGTAVARWTCPEDVDMGSIKVCGSDGQTYENICALLRARPAEPNLELLGEGPCEEDSMEEEEEEEQPQDLDSQSISENPLEEMPRAGENLGSTMENVESGQKCECPQDNTPIGNLNQRMSAMCCMTTMTYRSMTTTYQS